MLQKRGHRINRMSWKSESSKTTACAPAWGKVVAAGGTPGPFPAPIAGDQPLGFSSVRFLFRGLFPPELTQCARPTSRPDASLQATAFIIRATPVLCLRGPTLLCYLHRFGRQCSLGGTSSESPNRVLSPATGLPRSLFYHGARPLALPAHSSFITKPGHWPSSLPLSVSVVSVIVALVFTLLARLCFFFSCSSVPYLPVFVCPTLTPLSRCRVGSLWPLHAVFPRGAERL